MQVQADVHRMQTFIFGIQRVCFLRQPPRRNRSRVMGFAGSGNYLFRYFIYRNGLPWR